MRPPIAKPRSFCTAQGNIIGPIALSYPAGILRTTARWLWSLSVHLSTRLRLGDHPGPLSAFQTFILYKPRRELKQCLARAVRQMCWARRCQPRAVARAARVRVRPKTRPRGRCFGRPEGSTCGRRGSAYRCRAWGLSRCVDVDAKIW